MPIVSIEGKWKGDFRYDQGYPLALQARYVSFTMDLWTKNGMIFGICIDDHTKKLNIEPASIVGTFSRNIFKFTKTYPYLLAINENDKPTIVPARAPVPVQYRGRVRKRLFSSEYYCKGKASFTVSYLTKMGFEKSHTFWSVWSMKKI